MTTDPKILAVINDVAEDLRDLVTDIEAGIETTQDHYGDYLGILTTMGQGDAGFRKVIAVALLKAGANHDGVQSALKCSG
jgi:hypothetical protein